MVAQLDDIELPVDSTIASQIEPTNPTLEVESPMSIQLLESDIVNDPRECTDTEKVRPINLVLTEEPLRTPPTVVENLEEDLVTQELMSSGELSTATNASLNSTQMFSPVDNWDNVQEGLETVKESHKCIESTLTHIVDSILNVKQELSMISKDQLQSKISVEQDHLVKTDSRNAASTGTVLEAENKQIKDFHKELHQLRSLVQEISKSNQEFFKDMQSWHASAFSDESSSMIKKILEFCSYEEPTTAIVATQTDAILHVSHPRLAVQQRPILTSEEPQKEPRREKREEPRRAEPTSGFQWPVADKISISLKAAIQSDKFIKVCLITDSIMRHTTEFQLMFRKHEIKFDRIDRTDTESLGTESLRTNIARKQPHIIYIRLGINDIHKGRSVNEVMSNIINFEKFLAVKCPKTKLIISSLLLNGVEHQAQQILSLRTQMVLFKHKFAHFRGAASAQRIYIQTNMNFFIHNLDDGLCPQNLRYFDEKLLHLSPKGKCTIICNMRDSLDKIFKEFTIDS